MLNIEQLAPSEGGVEHSLSFIIRYSLFLVRYSPTSYFILPPHSSISPSPAPAAPPVRASGRWRCNQDRLFSGDRRAFGGHGRASWGLIPSCVSSEGRSLSPLRTYPHYRPGDRLHKN